jgi:hypothetical protein
MGRRSNGSDALDSDLAREIPKAMGDVSVQICTESEYMEKQDLAQKNELAAAAVVVVIFPATGDRRRRALAVIRQYSRTG